MNVESRNFRHNQLVTKLCSPHFTASEFRCNCKGKYCGSHPSKLNGVFLEMLEDTRNHFGVPFIVTGGMRCKNYNASIKGSIANSLHKSGCAADVCVNGKVSLEDIASYWKSKGYGYCYYGTSNMGKSIHLQLGW